MAAAQQTGELPRYWRNYLYWLVERGFRDQFDTIAQYIQQFLPSVRLLVPRVAPTEEEKVLFEYEEDGARLDVTSAGSGLRSIANLAVILLADPKHCMLFDEPDVHLHSSLQREVARILLDFVVNSGTQIFVATHAAEFLAEVPIENILWIDRHKQYAEPTSQLNKVLVELGAITAADAINRSTANKVLFIEGDTDETVLRQFFIAAGGYSPFLDSRAVIAHLPAGKSSSNALAFFPAYMRNAFGLEIKVAALTDNDYDLNTLPVVEDSEGGAMRFLHLQRKEIENYLIEPAVIAAAAASAAQSRSQYIKTEVPTPSEEDIRTQLNTIFDSAEIRDLVRYQILPRYRDMLDSKKDRATREAEAEDWFKERWSDFDWKLRNSPGKKVLATLRAWCQQSYKLTLTSSQIAQHITQLPSDFAEIHNALQTLFA